MLAQRSKVIHEADPDRTDEWQWNTAVWTRTGLLCVAVFFFSSRRRHTRSTRDWSSDVCSSDLYALVILTDEDLLARYVEDRGLVGNPVRQIDSPEELIELLDDLPAPVGLVTFDPRSEERRVGKECRSRWSTYYLHNKR